MECKFCHNTFSNKQNLNAHQNRSKYCLKIQGIHIPKKYKCSGCKKVLKLLLIFGDIKTCKNPTQLHKYEKQITEMNEELIKLREQVLIIQKGHSGTLR